MTFIDKKNICIKYWVHLLFNRTKLVCYCYQDGNTSKVSICSSLIINVNGLRWLLNRLTFFLIFYLWCFCVREREKEREQVNHSENILLFFVSLFVCFFLFFWRGGVFFFLSLIFFFAFVFGVGDQLREREQVNHFGCIKLHF